MTISSISEVKNGTKEGRVIRVERKKYWAEYWALKHSLLLKNGKPYLFQPQCSISHKYVNKVIIHYIYITLSMSNFKWNHDKTIASMNKITYLTTGSSR